MVAAPSSQAWIDDGVTPLLLCSWLAGGEALAGERDERGSPGSWCCSHSGAQLGAAAYLQITVESTAGVAC